MDVDAATVDLGDVAAQSLKLQVGAGKISAEKIHAAEISVAVDAGSARLKGLTGGIDASVSAGQLVLELDELTADVKVNVDMGSADIRLPKECSADLKLSADLGHVKQTFGDNFDGTNSENSIDGTVNGGGFTVKGDVNMGSNESQRVIIRKYSNLYLRATKAIFSQEMAFVIFIFVSAEKRGLKWDYQRLDQNAKKAWRLSWLITVVVLILIFGAIVLIMMVSAEEPLGLELWITGGIGFGFVVLFTLLAVIYPQFKYARWWYYLSPDRIEILRGVIFRSKQVVPLSRIQHVTINEGPLDRAFWRGKADHQHSGRSIYH